MTLASIMTRLTYAYMRHQKYSLSKLRSMITTLENVSALHKYMLCFNTISIRQASIYQSRGDIGLIWMWYSIVNQCFYNFEKLRKSRNGVILLSNPHPRINVSVQQQLYSYNDGKSLRYDMQGWGEYSSCSPPTMISGIWTKFTTRQLCRYLEVIAFMAWAFVLHAAYCDMEYEQKFTTQLEIWSSQYSSPTESY